VEGTYGKLIVLPLSQSGVTSYTTDTIEYLVSRAANTPFS